MTLKYVRNEDGHFVCPTCGITKENQNTMHYHMKKHENSLPFLCKFCKKGFLQKQTLDFHIRSKHADQLSDKTVGSDCSFECPFTDCEFCAKTRGNLRTHCIRSHFQDDADKLMLIDETNDEICCVECEHSFKSKTAFYYHCLECIDIPKTDKRYEHYKNLQIS
jgi:hypothetical protein